MTRPKPHGPPREGYATHRAQCDALPHMSEVVRARLLGRLKTLRCRRNAMADAVCEAATAHEESVARRPLAKVDVEIKALEARLGV